MNSSQEVSIVATGSYLPERRLTNADLEQMVDTTDEWIVTRTGIRERRIADDNCPSSILGARAVMSALEAAGMTPEDVQLLITPTITPDRPFPSTSCLIQREIGAMNAACFDLAAACSGFIYGLEVAKALLQIGEYENAVVVSAEKLSSVVDWEDRSTCVLFGDGAGAAVLKPGGEGHVLLRGYLGADGTEADTLQIPAGGSAMPAKHETVDQRLHYLHMNGNRLFKMATRRMVEALDKALERNSLKREDIRWIVPHQANTRIIQTMARMFGVEMDRVYMNLDRYGNMSAASVAVALHEASEVIEPGDLVALVAFGSGLTFAASIIRW